MNRALLLVFCFMGAPSLLCATDELPIEQAETAKSCILGFYQRQNLIGVSGQLLQNFLFKQRMVESSPEGNRETVVFMLSKDANTRLVYLRDDRSIPTAVLQRGTDTWIFREGLRLPLKISLSQSIFGEVNLADILGINLVDDFRCTALGGDGSEIALKCNRTNPQYPYPSVEVIVDRNSLEFRAIRYQSQGEITIREALLVDYRIIKGKHHVPSWNIRNLKLNTEKTTRLIYEDIRRITIADSFFQPNSASLTQFLVWARHLE